MFNAITSVHDFSIHLPFDVSYPIVYKAKLTQCQELVKEIKENIFPILFVRRNNIHESLETTIKLRDTIADMRGSHFFDLFVFQDHQNFDKELGIKNLHLFRDSQWGWNDRQGWHGESEPMWKKVFENVVVKKGTKRRILL
jgi:hypothetical protein